MWARVVALLTVLASALPAGAARGQGAADEAQAHFDRGAALAAEQKYDEAAAEFRASYELKGRKEALFAWAQVLRLAGDCPGAVELYRRFLRSPELTPTQSEAAQLGIDRCESAPAPKPAVAPPAPPVPAPAPVTVVTAPPPPPPTVHRSPRAVALGATLLGGLALALGASGTLYYLSRSSEKEALAASTWGQYREPAGRARSQQRWAIGLLGAGVLLGGGAILEWVATAPGKGTATAGLWIGDGVGVGLRGALLMRVALAGLLLLAGCREVAFTCATDDQCTNDGVSGWCEANHRCSFADTTCDSQRRYAPFGTDEACVPRAPPCAVAGVAAGGNFTCAWSNAGRVSCWGENGNGQLGDGTTNGRSTPAHASVTGVVEVVAGAIHACARLNDGSVSCWGDNSAQQLGFGDGITGNRATPAKLATIGKVVALTAGSRHTCARLADGSASCWGRNANGQLGDGTTTNRDKPTAVPDLAAVTQLAAGNTHTCAALGDGSVSCWGAIRNGPILPMWPAMQLSPLAVPGVAMAGRLVAGDSHACATSNGDVLCWGMNDLGQLGEKMLGRMLGATRVAGVSGAVDLTAGTNHTCARLEDGSARCWGSGAAGQLGTMVIDSGNLPVPSPGAAWKQVAAGTRHTCGLDTDGELYCWGRTSEGQLGDGTTLQWLMPDVAVLGARDLVAIATGAEHTCALGKAGNVLCWGRGDSGQLASPMNSSSVPVAVPLPGVAVQVVSGSGFSCARLADGAAHCWGHGNRGQIGDGKAAGDHLKPALVAIVEKVVHLAAGTDHACAVTMAGAVWCWGESGGGRLGNAMAMSTAQSKPLLVPLTGEFVQVGAGNAHTCALSRTQQVTCWGSSSYGQAGVGPVMTPVPPTAVAGLPPVTAMGVGGDHVCVIAPDGKVRCWGRGDSGQLGFGSTAGGTGLAQAVAIENFGPATAVAAASSHSCALVGGIGYCWGSNRWGQLGSGKAASSSRPGAVVKLMGVVAIDTGDRHSCAVLSDGTAFCWGGNQWGQLGNNVLLERLQPTKVPLECP